MDSWLLGMQTVFAKASRISLIIELISARSAKFFGFERKSIYLPDLPIFCIFDKQKADKEVTWSLLILSALSLTPWLFHDQVIGHLLSCLATVCDSVCFLELLRTIKLFWKQTRVLWKNDLGFPRVPHSRWRLYQFLKKDRKWLIKNVVTCLLAKQAKT